VQNAFEKHVGKEVKINDVVSTILTKNGEFKAQLAYDNRDGGLGYALFSQCKHTLNNGIVALKIDGVEPTDDNIQSGRYTLKTPVLVSIRISEAANSKTKLLYDWMISEQGLKCVG
jgi:ABC-type phosphate transport system substrate-binding protein